MIWTPEWGYSPINGHINTHQHTSTATYYDYYVDGIMPIVITIHIYIIVIIYITHPVFTFARTHRLPLGHLPHVLLEFIKRFCLPPVQWFCSGVGAQRSILVNSLRPKSTGDAADPPALREVTARPKGGRNGRNGLSAERPHGTRVATYLWDGHALLHPLRDRISWYILRDRWYRWLQMCIYYPC